MKIEVAAYCYSGVGQNHQIVIVTSSSGRWIIPKGHVEKGMKKREIALLEVWEEAGTVGVISGRAKEFIIHRGQKALWRIYPVKIRRLEDKWPEKNKRERRMVTPEEAIALIDNEDLADAILKLARKYRTH